LASSYEEEYAAIMSNNAWDLVLLPCDANIFTGKWIFKQEFKADRILERYKAR
jgi:hypothetical protein